MITEKIKRGQGAPPKLLIWLNSLWSDVKTNEPKSGSGIKVGSMREQGSIINADQTHNPPLGSITVTDGTTTLSGITTIHFDGTYLKVSSGGAGVANVVPQTESCP